MKRWSSCGIGRLITDDLLCSEISQRPSILSMLLSDVDLDGALGFVPVYAELADS
jgi:hypothetical protein